MKNKRGWIRIVEAFVAVLIIAGVLLVVVNKGYFGKGDITDKVYNSQISILREIELDSNLRADILSVPPENLPISWDEFGESGLVDVKDKISQRTPDYLNCQAKVCELNDICGQEEYTEEDVYVQSVAISANLQTYQPKQLKLFCTLV